MEASPDAFALPRRHREDGTSLLDLLLVLIIISTVSAIAIPRFANSAARYRSDAAARRVAADLRLAKAHAAATSAPVTVEFQTAAEFYTFPGVTGLGMLRPTDVYTVDLTRHPYRADLTMALFGGDETVIFDGYGAADTGGIIQIDCGGYVRAILLDDNSGEVRTIDGWVSSSGVIVR